MKNKTVAIIPCRSGSQSIRDKNIKKLFGTELFIHSINFAKKLSFIDEIYCLTDSNNYAKIALSNGAKVPYLRSIKTSSNTSMEEDILYEFYNFHKKNKLNIPKNILWLRPTHPLRSINHFKDAYKLYLKSKKSVCVVYKTDSRIFLNKKNYLIPILSDFKNKSMVRRQDVTSAYKIFSGEIFKMPKKYNKMFLGEKIRFIETYDYLNIDID